ncbi:unnamed protein product [Danaus chrysippus]|uniref:(African queen) hypothetical protein n=1 Tax=Danaus chrysippus TaxID=151541 RepID=A0A8J2R4B9_9NEOP|nr:unnamed protein product [Danaus chrysippus]
MRPAYYNLQLTLPSLQRQSSRACLSCGGLADSYCSGCGLAPYCSTKCQQSDWNRRHRYVCHNLACSTTSEFKVKESIDVPEPEISSPAPLRQPHSSNRKDYKADVNNKTKKNFNQKQIRTNSSFQNKTMRRPRLGGNEENLEQTGDAGNKQGQTINHIPNKIDMKPETKPETVKPKPDDKPIDKEPMKPPATVQDVTPKSRTIVPKEYLLEKLSLNDTVLLSVDSEEAGVFVCLSLHETNEDDYQLLCGQFGEECEGRESVVPKPGDLFALFYSEDGAWYRARRLSNNRVALIDSSKVVDINSNDRMVELPPKYIQIPECCCQLKAKVKLGDNLKCTLVSKTSDGFRVSLRNAETDVDMGQGEVKRWKPAVEYEVDKTHAAIPEVPRPSLSNMAAVFLVHNSGVDMFVRPVGVKLQGVFESLIQDEVAAGMKALPFKDPPRAGQTVLCQHTDGLYYRGLCKRTNFKKNKYMIEFIEYGNTVITTLEKLALCPEDLDIMNRPTPVSVVKLDLEIVINDNGQQYLEKIRDDEVELIVNSKDKSAVIQSGSVVDLVDKKTKESLTKKLEIVCSPEWKKIEQNGGDVVDCEPLMYSSLEYFDLPSSKCELCVLDISTFREGALGVCDVSIGHEKRLQALTEQIEAYVKSDLGKDPYLPKIEELCLAPCPPYPQYFRAVLCSHTAGSSEATVCYVDYNNVDTVDVASIRKMMRDFTHTPALACHAEIRGFPSKPSDTQLARALEYMKIDDQGRGKLSVEKCEKIDPGFYIVDAPELLAAMMQ